MSTSIKRSAFMRFAAGVADFGDPFYAEERQRDVWNEASAFGFQLMLWGTLSLGTVMLWVGGHESLPCAASVIGLGGLAAALTVGYAGRLGVTAAGNWSVNRRRYVALAVLLLALAGGLVRALAEADSTLTFDASTIAGLLVGASAALLLVWVIGRSARVRRAPEADDEP